MGANVGSSMKRRQFLKISLPLVVMGDIRAKNSDNPVLSFGVIADPQYADQAARGTRHYLQSVEKLRNAIGRLNQNPLDFVVTLGDVIDKDFASFDTMMPLYDALKAPARFVLGNHDFAVADDKKKDVIAAMKMQKAYYSELRQGWRLIYLDGADISTYRYPKDDPRTISAEKVLMGLKKEKLPQAASWNAGIGKQQMQWFKKELDTAKSGGERVIVFNHYPVCPVHEGHNLWNAKEVVDLIASYDHVMAYMNGHNHRGNYAEHKGCHYVNFKGMVETENTNAYAIVKCFTDRIEIDGVGSEPDRKLE